MSLILSGSDGVSDIDGTAATPAIRGTDTNTGIFFPAADTIAFSEGGAESARFNSSGNLGIGTTSPTGKLHVYGSGEVQTLQRSSGSANNYTLFKTESGADQAYLGFSDGGVNDFAIYNVQNGYIRFGTNNAERMRITTGGNVFISCTSEPSSSVPGWGITKTGAGIYVSQACSTTAAFDHIYFNTSGGLAGNIRTSGTSTTYNSVSDVRLKDNIVDSPSALSDVNNIKVRSFDWKSTQSHVKYGFIAQELNEIAPEAVAEGESTEEGEMKTPWAVDSSMLVPMLIKAIQELKTELDSVKSELATLKAPL
jgi:hypothetical protein